MTQQVEPVSATASITTTFGYDAAGNRTRLTDGRGNKTVYTFNSWACPSPPSNHPPRHTPTPQTAPGPPPTTRLARPSPNTSRAASNATAPTTASAASSTRLAPEQRRPPQTAPWATTSPVG
ncbi:hypothetical protein D3C59_18085 [Streptomyces sp. SHP22-7]|nr:hypothetical protein D3C59_18085 [Streptomyces sp. SHP22-7]